MSRLFNGTDQQLEGDFTLNVPLTMACWYNASNVTTTFTLMQIGVAGGSDQGRLAINLNGALTGDPMRASTTNAAGTVSFAESTTAFTAGTWRHACGVWASSASRAIYNNGAGKGTEATLRAISTPTKVNIGGSQTTTGAYPNWFSGSIAEACIWNVALSDAEVALIAKPGFKPTNMRPSNIVAYWPLIGRHNPEIGPIGGLDLSYIGTPTIDDHPRFVQSLC